MIVNGKRVKKKKTTPRKCTPASAPAWNEAFTFNVSQSNLQNAAFEVKEKPTEKGNHTAFNSSLPF